MPEIQILDDYVSFKPYIIALMDFPNDSTLRLQYEFVEAVRASTYQLPDDLQLTTDVKTLRVVTESPSYEEIRSISRKSVKKGIIAGDLLSSLYLMSCFGVPEPSMKKAIHILKNYADKEEYGDGSKMPGSDKKIRDCWNEYKPVAHLWAAFRINQSFEFCPHNDIFSTKDNIIIMLRVAATLLEFGSTFIPKRARPAEPFLNMSDCWTLPMEIRAAALSLPKEPRPEIVTKLLDKYRAPIQL